MHSHLADSLRDVRAHVFQSVQKGQSLSGTNGAIRSIHLDCRLHNGDRSDVVRFRKRTESYKPEKLGVVHVLSCDDSYRTVPERFYDGAAYNSWRWEASEWVIRE